MELKTVTCDECGRVKGETNHWFKAIASDGHFEIFEISVAALLFLKSDLVMDLCSENCAVKAMSKAIGQASGHAGQSADVPQLCPACKETIWFGRLHLCVEVPRRRWHEQSEVL